MTYDPSMTLSHILNSIILRKYGGKNFDKKFYPSETIMHQRERY